MRYGMLIDLRKCVGCTACSIACKGANATPAGINYNKIKKYEVGTFPNAKMKSIPMPCMHCEDAPCVKVCPSKASIKNEDGIVTIDASRCMGCRACIIACPYESRQFIWEVGAYYEGQNATPFEEQKQGAFEEGVVTKCKFCRERLEDGEQPACVQTCIASARIFGDLDDPNSEISKLIVESGAVPFREEQGTQPLVYYVYG